ncbi:SDR family NAD(P)-dependent oxidoreductase [Luminiphilus sp. nBUS_16]|uniref:SDR family NAD(P)-dependent oxidoreductase n=1 Tax=Luminiphilus sp. nBUS_16 TaxID=3395315 RepID=UPI003EBB34C1
MFALTGKNALVTGGSSGIGLAVVKRFIAAGAQVIAADLNLSPKLRDSGAHFVALDVSCEESLERVFAEVESRFGKLDILVNNAGVGLDEGPIVDADTNAFHKTMAVNLNGVLYGLKHGPKHMNDGGSIINTSSLAAFITMPEYTGYSVSKAGVVKLTQQCAVELASRKIRVNAVCPGTTTTPMEPADSGETKIMQYLTLAGRPGTVEEQAAVFHFLAADDSSYVNAQAIAVDGGCLPGLNYALMDKLLPGFGQK